MALTRLSLLLIGCTLSCATASAWASLIVPPLDTTACLKSLEATTSHPSRTAPPQDSSQRNWQLPLSVAAHVAGGQQSTGGAGGSSSSSNSQGSYCLAAHDNAAVLYDSTAATWLREGRWLAVPMPPGVELLRPPQKML